MKQLLKSTMPESPKKSTAYVIVTAFAVTETFVNTQYLQTTLGLSKPSTWLPYGSCSVNASSTVTLITPYSFNAKSTDSPNIIFQAYGALYQSLGLGDCSDTAYPSASLPSTPKFKNNGLISVAQPDHKWRIIVAIVLPAFGIAVAITSFLAIQRHRKRKRALPTQKTQQIRVAHIGVDQKPEMEAEEKAKYELEANECRYEVNGVDERWEVHGEHQGYEVSTERGNNGPLAVAAAQELRGEEHSKELEGSCL